MRHVRGAIALPFILSALALLCIAELIYPGAFAKIVASYLEENMRSVTREEMKRVFGGLS